MSGVSPGKCKSNLKFVALSVLVFAIVIVIVNHLFAHRDRQTKVKEKHYARVHSAHLADIIRKHTSNVF